MFSSYQPMSATSPTKPKSAVSVSATMTRVWPRSSRQSARDIFGHHRALRDRELIEDRHEEAERRSGAVRVADGHAKGIRGADVVPRARQPRLALLDKVEVVAIHHRPAVQLVCPDVHETRGLAPARRRLPDTNLVDVRERDPRAGAGEDALDRRDDVRIHRR